VAPANNRATRAQASQLQDRRWGLDSASEAHFPIPTRVLGSSEALVRLDRHAERISTKHANTPTKSEGHAGNFMAPRNRKTTGPCDEDIFAIHKFEPHPCQSLGLNAARELDVGSKLAMLAPMPLLPNGNVDEGPARISRDELEKKM